MNVQNYSGENLEVILNDINYDINLLYTIPCNYTRDLVLNHLKNKITLLNSAVTAMGQALNMQPLPLPIQSDLFSGTKQSISQQPAITNNQNEYTLAELSEYDGKNGNPAYVAVNGIVYDVTNNAVWAAATHFGLTAGRDLTLEFASCHAGQPILNKLVAVGRLV